MSMSYALRDGIQFFLEIVCILAVKKHEVSKVSLVSTFNGLHGSRMDVAYSAARELCPCNS